MNWLYLIRGYNSLLIALILILIFLVTPGDSGNREPDILIDSHINRNAVKNRSWGYLVDHGRVVLQGMQGKTIQFVTWIAGNDGQWKENRVSREIEVESDPFIISAGAVTIFWGDMHLVKLFGRDFQSLHIALMLINTDNNKTIAQKTWSIGTVKLGTRTIPDWEKGTTIEERIIRQYNPWNGRMHPGALLQPVHRAVYNKPSGRTSYAISYGIHIPSVGDIKSIKYLANGNRMLVSDENSYLYLVNLNNQKVLWKIQAIPGSRNPLYIFDISEDGRYFLTGQKPANNPAQHSLFVHRMRDGDIIRKIDEKSDYIDKLGNDNRGEPMQCTGAIFYNRGKQILSFWKNRKATHGQFDLSMKSYHARSGRQRWEWQILDSEGLDPDRRIYNRDLRIMHLEKVTGQADHFYLFSRTGRAYLLTPYMIKKGMTMFRADDKPSGAYQYTVPHLFPGRSVVKGLAPSDMPGICWMSYTNEAGEGTVSLFDITSGEVKNRTVFSMKFPTISTGGNGRFIMTFGDGYCYVWDTMSRYLVFNIHTEGSVAFHPKVREIALVWNKKEIRFAIERPLRTFKVNDSWKEIDLFAGPDTCFYAYSMKTGVRFGMHMQKDKPRIVGNAGFIVRQGMMAGAGNWSRWLTETGEKGTKLVVKSGSGTGILEIWGGFSKQEWKLSRARLRRMLKQW